MGFSDTSLCKICPNDHPGKVSSIVRVTLIGSELLFFDSIDVKLAQCKEMNYFLSHLTIPKLFLLKLTLMLALSKASILLCRKFTHDIVIQKIENGPLCPWAYLSLAQWALSHRKNLKSWVTNCPLRTLSFDLRGI